MKKTISKSIYAALAVAVIIGTLGASTVSAHDNGENNGTQDNGNHFGFFHNLNLRFFHHNENDNEQENIDKNKDKNENDSEEKDKNDEKDINQNQNSDNESNRDHNQNFRGVAKVTAVSGNQITANSVFGKENKTLTINTTSTTTFALGNGTVAALSNIHVGDVISFKGNETDNNSSFIINATSIRDWGNIDLSSKAKITGTVTSVNDINNTLVIKTNDNQIVSVNASGDTVVKNNEGDNANFTDIHAGATVKAKGFWDSLKSFFTAFSIKILR